MGSEGLVCLSLARTPDFDVAQCADLLDMISMVHINELKRPDGLDIEHMSTWGTASTTSSLAFAARCE